MTREIPLTRGFLALVDDADFARLGAMTWRALVKPSGTVYAIASDGAYMHRLIVGALPGEDVDHRDGNGLRNVRENLRRCNRSQNNMNSRVRGAFKGVQRRGDAFQAKIGLQGRRIALGTFRSEIDAALAYDTAAKQFFGEFARLNFPDTHPATPSAANNAVGGEAWKETRGITG